jgi:RHS repeat-associated protein
VARYTYAPLSIDAAAVQERELNAADKVAEGYFVDAILGDTNEVVYYHANVLSTTYALTDSSGSVVERYRYDAYGATTVLDADGSADADGASDVENPYTFTGRRLDTETGLMQYRNRYYSAELGRFVSRDPAGYVDGVNLYHYARSQPTKLADPHGEAAITVAVVVFTAGRGITHLILGGVYYNNCLECVARAEKTADWMVEQLERAGYDALDIEKYLRRAKPGAECATICGKAGKEIVRGMKWVICGVGIKYSVRLLPK